ncbi:MAG: CRISPR system precrRNA processing endoribonuclease RAMP protein Cas6 [Syntrophales bacterium]
MRYGRYRFVLILEDDAILPEYKGSTFRGIFGHALKKVVCALKRQVCEGCILSEKCVYALVFETSSISMEDQSPGAGNPSETRKTSGGIRKRIAAPPHPYVIEPPDAARTTYRRGDALDFTFLIFGSVNEYLPYFIYAFTEMGKLGIGKRVGAKRATFILDKVVSGERLVFDGREGKIRTGTFTEDISIAPLSTEAGRPGISIRLVTPLRLKFENHFKAELPFHVLTRAMLRRVSTLLQYYGDGEPALDYRGLVERAKAIVTESSAIRWFDWKRYSNRQDQSMLMGGMVGDVNYAGNLDEFLPIIRFCEKVHLGKQTAFGLGKIQLNPLKEDKA